MLKKTWMAVLASLMAVCVSFPLAAAEPIELKAAFYMGNPVTTPVFTAHEAWAKEVQQKTNGRYKIKFYWDGTMGSTRDLPGLCANGVVDFFFSCFSYTPTIFPLTSVSELIYITENHHAASIALQDLYKTYKPLRDEWDRAGLKLYAANSFDSGIILTNTPISRHEDFNGLKIRALGPSATMLKLWGAQPVNIAYMEVYEALQRRTVQGILGPLNSSYDMKFWEHAKYVTNVGMGIYIGGYTAMSRKTYDKMPNDMKAIFDTLGDDLMRLFYKRLDWVVRAQADKFIASPCILKKLNTEEIKRAEKATVPMAWESWIATASAKGPAKELLELYKKKVRQAENTPEGKMEDFFKYMEVQRKK